MEKRLKLHTELSGFTIGEEYDVVEENANHFIIMREKEEEVSESYRHLFTKEKDEFGESYKSWFDLVEG